MIEHVVTARAEENMFGKTKNRYNPPYTLGARGPSSDVRCR
jgi:hypothetical protein